MSAQNALIRWRLRKKKGLFSKYLGSTFSPPSLANLVGWWDASNITGLANNDPVTTWSDKSGLGNNIAQTGDASMKPTYKTNQQNSLPAVSFDGGDILRCDSVAAYFAGTNKPSSCITVLKRTSDAGNEYVAACGIDAAVPNYFHVAFWAGDRLALRQSDGSVGNIITAAYGAGTNAHIDAISDSGTVVNTWTNAVKKINAGDSTAGATSVTQFGVGAWPRSGATTPFTGLIMEMLLYNTALSEADLSIIWKHLASKWAISI